MFNLRRIFTSRLAPFADIESKCVKRTRAHEISKGDSGLRLKSSCQKACKPLAFPVLSKD